MTPKEIAEEMRGRLISTGNFYTDIHYTIRRWADLLDPKPATKQVVRVTLDVEATARGGEVYLVQNVKLLPLQLLVDGEPRVTKFFSAEVVEVPA